MSKFFDVTFYKDKKIVNFYQIEIKKFVKVGNFSGAVKSKVKRICKLLSTLGQLAVLVTKILLFRESTNIFKCKFIFDSIDKRKIE